MMHGKLGRMHAAPAARARRVGPNACVHAQSFISATPIHLNSYTITEEVGSTMAFLRRGYKTSTWFEEEEQLEQSKEWRM